jgi:hypothetical protein
MRGPPRQPIDGFSCADSVIALLDHLPLQKLPEEERIALAAIQTRAIETFLDASPLPFAGDQGSFRFEPRELPHTLPERSSGGKRTRKYAAVRAGATAASLNSHKPGGI